MKACPGPVVSSGFSTWLVVFARDGFLDVGGALVFRDCSSPVRVDDRDLLRGRLDMAQDEGKRAAADGAEADHHNRAIPGGVHVPIAHFIETPVFAKVMSRYIVWSTACTEKCVAYAKLPRLRASQASGPLPGGSRRTSTSPGSPARGRAVTSITDMPSSKTPPILPRHQTMFAVSGIILTLTQPSTMVKNQEHQPALRLALDDMSRARHQQRREEDEVRVDRLLCHVR